MASKTLSKIKGEMTFNQDLTRLVDVMKGIAAAQYQAMERKLTKQGHYLRMLKSFFDVYDFRSCPHPFVHETGKRKVVCMITTDSGFLGGLNMKVVQVGLKQEEEATQYVVVGDRGANYVREFGRQYTSFPGVNADDSRFPLARRVADFLIATMIKGNFNKLSIVYPHPVSFTIQRIEVVDLVPCPMFWNEKSEVIATDEQQASSVILESPAPGIIEYLTVLWVRMKMLDIFELAKLSEYGARTMHLEESYQTLSELNKQLKLDFFKARREKIDQSLRETFCSRLVIK